jgi:hypothetical protein
MSANLNEYLSKVFRNEVQDKTAFESEALEVGISHFNDSKINQFLIDRRYSLRLDEII